MTRPARFGLAAILPFAWSGAAAAMECSGATCARLRSCEQAVYETYVCGETVRDRDGDGVPCESLCTPAAAARAKAKLGLDR